MIENRTWVKNNQIKKLNLDVYECVQHACWPFVNAAKIERTDVAAVTHRQWKGEREREKSSEKGREKQSDEKPNVQIAIFVTNLVSISWLNIIIGNGMK